MISHILLLPHNHSKLDTIKENYKKLLIFLWVNLVKDTQINTSTAPKSNVKVINYMDTDIKFDLIVDFIFSTSPQLVVNVPKAQELVISFHLEEVESLP